MPVDGVLEETGGRKELARAEVATQSSGTAEEESER
jgi:hypothetical protein